MRHPILVVDGDRALRDHIVEILDREGFVGIPAANGAEALSYLRAGGSATVILLDAMMPVMDGWTFRREQKRDPLLSDIPVIAVSALQGRPVEGLSPNATIQKPVDVKELLTIVRALCRQRTRAALTRVR
jgi:DNA-binding response OmpR family regulator